MTFQIERRPLGETETERSRTRQIAAAEAARARAGATTPRRRFALTGVAPRGYVSANLNGGGRCHTVTAEKLRLDHDPRQVDLEKAIAATKSEPERPKPVGAANAWHVRMVGWLGEIIDPVPRIFSAVKKGEPLKPLNKGADRHLLARLKEGVAAKRLNRWLDDWVGSPAYLEAKAAEGSQHHDLDGRAVTPLHPGSRARAFALLPAAREALFAKIEAKAAEQPQELAASSQQMAGLLDALGLEDVAQGEAVEWCAECLRETADLEDGLCGDCRAAAVPDDHLRQHGGVDQAEQHGAIDQAEHRRRRAAARRAGERKFIGKPCSAHGPGAPRYVCNGGCVECTKERARA